MQLFFIWLLFFCGPDSKAKVWARVNAILGNAANTLHTQWASGIRGVCVRAQANYRRPRCCSVACWLVTAEMSALFAHCSRGHRARTTGGPTAQNSASPSTRKNFTPSAVRESERRRTPSASGWCRRRRPRTALDAGRTHTATTENSVFKFSNALLNWPLYLQLNFEFVERMPKKLCQNSKNNWVK